MIGVIYLKIGLEVCCRYLLWVFNTLLESRKRAKNMATELNYQAP